MMKAVNGAVASLLVPPVSTHDFNLKLSFKT